MKEYLTVTIVAAGTTGTGKSTAIHDMARALAEHFEIRGQVPMQQMQHAETYTILLKLKD